MINFEVRSVPRMQSCMSWIWREDSRNSENFVWTIQRGVKNRVCNSYFKLIPANA